MNDTLLQNLQSWDAMADTWFGATALPAYGCLAPTEDELSLFPPLFGKRVLDLGCGSGHSLLWCAGKGAAELWGVDLSARQLENARRLLGENGLRPTLLRQPMESAEGLPAGYFDVVYSIYALGWSTDLPATLRAAAACLRPGGCFVFSWDHPLMHCVEGREGELVFSGVYRDEAFSYVQRGQPVTVQNRKLSTYLNALADAGLLLERLIEQTDEETLSRPAEFSSSYYAPWKARKMPLSFVVKARKP